MARGQEHESGQVIMKFRSLALSDGWKADVIQPLETYRTDTDIYARKWGRDKSASHTQPTVEKGAIFRNNYVG